MSGLGSGIGAAENSATAALSAARVIIARADIAYAHAALLRVHAKGNFGEAVAQRYFLRDKLGEAVSGKWTSLTPRVGRQGFDHLFVRQRGGKFIWMVCESKYGSSQLGMTKGGVQQMSWVWIHDRAARLGDAYLKIADRPVTIQKQPWFKGGIRTYEVPLDDGTKVTFWRDKNGKWHFDGPKDKLAQAQAKARKMGADLKSPTCNIRGRKFHITTDGNDVKITLEDLKSSAGSKSVESSKVRGEIVLKDILNKKISDGDLKKAIAEELRKKFPNLKPSEIRELAEEIAEGKTNGSLIKEAMTTAGRIALQSVAAAGIATAMDIALQYVLTQKIDVRRVALTAGATAVGTGVGQLTTIVFIKTKGGANAVRILQRAFKLRSASLMRNSLAGGVGAVATSGILAYGRVWLGRSSWNEAHQEFVSGIAGTAGGALVVTGVTSAVAAWGTAGTGTAIASLSGAAQTNAILAWLGMGGGKFVGGIVLGGIGVVATIVVGFGASFAISKFKESLNRDYIILKGEKFDDLSVWLLIASRNLKGLSLS